MPELSSNIDNAIKELRRRLGKAKVIDDPAIAILYTREPSGIRGSHVKAVVFPEEEKDVSLILKTAYKYNVPIYPQGSSTSLSGNSVPLEPGIVVSMERMNRVLEINIVDNYVVVEPGVRMEDLNAELAKYRYMFPVDPASSSVATIGGAINNGAGGLRGAKYGTMRDWLLAVRLGIADEEGSILNLGCYTVKCRSGYDLARLIVGSEGTLGIVTRAVLRITPLPEDTVYALSFFDSLEDLMEAFIEIRRSRLNPFMLEFMDSATVDYASKSLDLPYEPKGNLFLVGIETSPESNQRILDTLTSLLESHGAHTIITAHGDKEAHDKKLFAVRKNLFTGQARYTLEKEGSSGRIMVMIEDIVVPPSKVPEAVTLIRGLGEKYGFTVFIGGHIGDGNLHPAVGFNAEDEEERKRVEQWFHEVMEIALKLGGSISAEHGIGLLKKQGLRMELEYKNSLKALQLMKEIKKAFDPKGLLNPGKVL
ncbi:MAG: FAD-binding protein [Desulfurococcales archaeon]|nr:FAD-binding protein [Desulfurococcales archaeon]